MYSYKTVFLESTFVQKKGRSTVKGHVDAWTTSRDLEALLIEEDKSGFELVTVSPVNSNVVGAMGYPVTVTIGLIVTLRRKESNLPLETKDQV